MCSMHAAVAHLVEVMKSCELVTDSIRTSCSQNCFIILEKSLQMGISEVFSVGVNIYRILVMVFYQIH